ncbi:hypothetical protein SD457_12275 [Coprobacillaceae bacterium CR2/5/TPMF4]|nr:hypothetical protein SD457_12275 [Coprobacillaceae bacterium CR2/5/TPMF4]
MIVEEIITNQKTRQQMYYLHYEISDKTEINELVENFKWRIFNINRQDFIIKKMINCAKYYFAVLVA